MKILFKFISNLYDFLSSVEHISTVLVHTVKVSGVQNNTETFPEQHYHCMDKIPPEKQKKNNNNNIISH